MSRRGLASFQLSCSRQTRETHRNETLEPLNGTNTVTSFHKALRDPEDLIKGAIYVSTKDTLPTGGAILHVQVHTDSWLQNLNRLMPTSHSWSELACRFSLKPSPPDGSNVPCMLPLPSLAQVHSQSRKMNVFASRFGQ